MAFRSQRMALGTTNRLAVNTDSGGEFASTGIGGFVSPKYRPLTGTGSLQPFSPEKKLPKRPKTMSPGSPKGRTLKPGSPTVSIGRHHSATSADKYFTGERLAFSPQGIQNLMETKKTTPRVLSWSTVKDRKLDATSTRLKHSTHETKPLVRTIPQTDRLDASTVLDRQSGHFFPLGRLMAEPQKMTEQTRKSTEWVELSKVSWGEVFPGSYAAIGGAERPPTDRNTKSFSVEGWGPGNHIDFDAFPSSQFMPDVSALLTSRIVNNKTPPHSANPSSNNGSQSQRSERGGDKEAATQWDPFQMTTTQRISISNSNANDTIDSIKVASKKSKDGALRSRDMVKLQQSLTFQVQESELQEGHMKGVMAKPTNFKRPFSPVDFSVLTTSKQGRPMGEPLIGVGTHVPAGLPTPLRYNQRPEMIEAVNHTMTRKGHSNNFPFHSGQSCEGYVKQPRILEPGEFIRSSHTLKPRVFRPSFDKGVELDGQLAQGRRPRDLTLYHSVGIMKN